MRQAGRGFTLTELMLAIAITAMTGLAVAGASHAVLSAYGTSDDHYEQLQIARGAMHQSRLALRKARLVVNGTTTSLIYWAEDANNDGAINVSELAELAYNRADREIREYRVVIPDSLSQQQQDALNVAIALSSVTGSPGSASGLIRDSSYVVWRLVASDVRYVAFGAVPAAPLARTVTIRITVGTGETSLTLRSAVTLRADLTGEVGLSQGQYVLDGETDDFVTP